MITLRSHTPPRPRGPVLPGPRSAALGLSVLLGLASPTMAAPDPAASAVPPTAPATVMLEEMTSPELRARIAAGSTTALVPIGGTEQNGPHMVLGKHNVRARVLATRIAQQLGHTVVAPVISLVPEGGIHPPQAHMKQAGTLSIPEPVFEALLESTARSLCEHGLKDVFFLGDHGGYQASLQRAAQRVAKPGPAGAPPCRAHALTEYYRVTQTAYVADLKQRGFTEAEIGTHAGLADTALALAVDPALVRRDARGAIAAPAPREGVHGDPTRATLEMGQVGVQRIVETSVTAVRAALAAR